MVTALSLIPMLLKENFVEMVVEITEDQKVDPKGKIVPILICCLHGGGIGVPSFKCMIAFCIKL
jgi:hypothetical protein